MSFVSYRRQFLDKLHRQLEQGAQDVAGLARRNLGGGGALSGSVKVIRTGHNLWQIGSAHPGAMAQEHGAFLRPRRRRALKFAGRYAMHARVPGKRWLSRAGQLAPKVISRRLRGA